MHTAQARQIEFAPPPPHGTGRSLTFSLIVHGLLLIALTAGINWRSDSLSTEAELWSAVPQAAAPKLVEVEPAPPPPPPPPPKPLVKPTAPPAPDREAEIALAKKRKQEDEQKKLEAKREEERRKLDELKKAEEKKQKELKDKLKAEEEKRKLDAQKEKERKEREKEKEQKEKERRDKDAKKQQDQKDSKQAAEEAKKLEAIRRDNLKRIQGLAGATGDENATGTALKASGPSDSYAGRIRARVKPNISFNPADVSGNPEVRVLVRCAPDGTILVPLKITQSSGNATWDDAVVRALMKTEVIPKDTDGRLHCPLDMGFRPKD